MLGRHTEVIGPSAARPTVHDESLGVSDITTPIFESTGDA